LNNESPGKKEVLMQIAIIGAGSVAYGNAVLLCQNGHQPVIWSPSNSRAKALVAGSKLTSTGAIEGSFSPGATQDVGDALATCRVVLIAVPGYGHRTVIDAIVPHLTNDHVVIISAHLSFSALYLSKRLVERGVRLPIVAWSTTITTGRQTDDAGVKVGNVRSTVDVAVIPVSESEKGLSICRQLFGDRFAPKKNLLAIALSNLNPQDHMGIALCNLTRIERGEHWLQNQNITSTVGKLLEALDEERLAIAECFKLKVRTISDHFAMSFDISGGSVGDMSQRLHERGNDSPGPTSLSTRYVTEDVPFGLVPTLMLAEFAGKPVPLHRAGVLLFDTMYSRHFADENDILPELGELGFENIERRCEYGYGAR
jgi:opine dehydrogenase